MRKRQDEEREKIERDSVTRERKKAKGENRKEEKKD